MWDNEVFVVSSNKSGSLKNIKVLDTYAIKISFEKI